MVLLFIYVILFICLFLAVPSLRGCTGFSPVVASVGCSLVAVHRLLIAVASLIVEHGLRGMWALVAVACGLSGMAS